MLAAANHGWLLSAAEDAKDGRLENAGFAADQDKSWNATRTRESDMLGVAASAGPDRQF